MSKKVWAARELFSRIGAVHREEEFGDAHSSLRGVHTKIGSNRKSVVAPCPVRRRPVAGSSQLSTLNSQLTRPGAPSRFQAIRGVACVLRISQCVRPCQHE